jgi:hypothetical protein
MTYVTISLVEHQNQLICSGDLSFNAESAGFGDCPALPVAKEKKKIGLLLGYCRLFKMISYYW